MDLILGGRKNDRAVPDAERLLVSYRADDGWQYLEYNPTSPSDCLVPEDLAVTLLINSRATGRCFKSIQRFGESINLGRLTRRPLESTTVDERRTVAEIIAVVASWPGFASSIATKVLHKKRPALIPILDNQAIFGAYMNPAWPERKSLQDSVKDVRRIQEALDWIATDLVRAENTQTWQALRAIEPDKTLIQLFDSVWWMYFRKNERLGG